MKYWLSVLFCGMLLTAYTQACQLVVRGTIFDEFSAQPLDFAEVYLEEGETGTVSDEAGNFVLDNLCPGDYTSGFPLSLATPSGCSSSCARIPYWSSVCNTTPNRSKGWWSPASASSGPGKASKP